MFWLRYIAFALSLGSATFASAQLFNYPPATKDTKPANLELRLEPKDIQNGKPQAFTFVLVNISDHDVRVPVGLLRNCGGNFQKGYFRLGLKFTPLKPGIPRGGYGCSGDGGDWPPILERIRSWNVLRPNESLRVEVEKKQLNYDDTEPGTYDFWAIYFPPSISQEDQAVLRQAGIDFPHDMLSSAHVEYGMMP